MARRREAYWPVELRHDMVGLRPIRVADQTAWETVRLRNRGWLQPWDATRPPGREPGGAPRTFKQMVRRLTEEARRGVTLPWVIAYGPAGARPRLAGQVTVGGIQYGSARSASIGYWVDSALAGRGIVPTAVALATDYCFEELRLHRVEIAIRPENARSLRVVAKLGFRHEGSRPAFLHIDGAWRDHEIFVLTAGEAGPNGVLARYLAC